MGRIQNIPWDDARDLRAVRILAQLINQRWELGVGFVTSRGTLLEGDNALHYASQGDLCTVLQAHSQVGQCQKMGDSLAQRLRRKAGLVPSSVVHTCHAGLNEVAAPVVLEGEIQGLVLAGGFIKQDQPDQQAVRDHLQSIGLKDEVLDQAMERMPRLDATEQSYLCQLVETIAGEIVSFQLEAHGDERRVHARPVQRRGRYSYDEIIGQSPPMEELYRLLDKVIDSDSTVLIQGDNGTGKELIARAIHFNSWRKDRRFVVQNCSAFNDNLLDSELFGHKKGSFTGAIGDKQGLFEVADGGTFFLDEIGDMSPALQVKLLRVLQEGTFIPVGDTRNKHVDVRIIAATNRHLKQMVDASEFREDLYYRVNVINIAIPPLRERKEDIPPLVEHFLRKHGRGNRQRIKKLSRGCMQRLTLYNWPGNIRELENEIERLVVLARDTKFIGEDLLSSRIAHPLPADEAAGGSNPSCLPDAIRNLERTMIYEVLKRNHWNKTRAAQELHISRRNLIRKVKKYELDQRTT